MKTKITATLVADVVKSMAAQAGVPVPVLVDRLFVDENPKLTPIFDRVMNEAVETLARQA